MEDFSKPVNTRTGNYTPRVVFNPAADVLAGIEKVEGAFKERRAKVNLFQAQAEQRRLDMQNSVNDTKKLDQTDTITKMTEQFSNMVTDVYKADIASFDGDRSGYLVKANNAQKVIGNFGKVIGVVDELSNKYINMNESEQVKMILRSQFSGANGEKKKAYIEFLNDPSKMNIRIQGQDIIITNNGKDLFNGTQLLNSVKAGEGLIEYANDYTKEIEGASKDAMKGIADLKTIESYKRRSSKGTKLYGTEKTNYENAINAYRKNLENSSKIDALINESTFQRYVDSMEVYSERKHGEITKQKIIEDLIIKEFPGGKEVITRRSTTPLGGSGSSTNSNTSSTKSYKPIVSKGKELSNFIKNPSNKYFIRKGQAATVPGGVKNDEYRIKLEEIKTDLKKQLNNTYSLRRLGQKDVIQDFEIAIDENTGEIKAYPMVQKVIENEDGTKSEELVIQKDFGQGIIIDDNNLFKFDKILGGVDSKTILETSTQGGASKFNTNK